MSKMVVCVPFTGLGLYGGYRGDRWLRNRIKIFKQFVVPSLLNQTDQDFVLWVAWREEEKMNLNVDELYFFLKERFNVVFTYTGCPMWDDKYPDDVARERLFRTLKGALPELMEPLAEADEILWLLQPSDDCYHQNTFASFKKSFADKKDVNVISFQRGFICNYTTMEVLEYNPKTNPPFFCVRYPRKAFFDPGLHMNWTGPFKSHEYIGEKLNEEFFDGRGFLVGCHGENISTHFNHPYGGERVEEILPSFGLSGVESLSLPFSLRKWVMRHLPHPVRRKLRYWFGEIIGNRVYNFLRN